MQYEWMHIDPGHQVSTKPKAHSSIIEPDLDVLHVYSSVEKKMLSVHSDWYLKHYSRELPFDCIVLPYFTQNIKITCERCPQVNCFHIFITEM